MKGPDRQSWNPFLPQVFCSCFTLQSGVVGLSVAGLTLMIATVMKNVLDENGNTWDTIGAQTCLLGVYIGIMSAALSMGFLAAFWEEAKYLKICSLMLGVGLLLYLIYIVLSFVPSQDIMLVVCPGLRCPDHHWMVPSQWREQAMGLEGHGARRPYIEYSTTTEGQRRTYSHHSIVLYMLGSAIGTILYVVYVMWTIITYLSFEQELHMYSRD